MREFGEEACHNYKSRLLSKWRKELTISEIVITFEDIIKYYRDSHKRKEPRHIFHGLTKCMICKKALVTDRAKKGWLCCRNCTGREKKLIETERLYQLFFDRLNIFLTEETKNREKESRICEYVKKIQNNLSTNVEREMLLNIFVKKIFVGENENIVIFWRFKR